MSEKKDKQLIKEFNVFLLSRFIITSTIFLTVIVLDSFYFSLKYR